MTSHMMRGWERIGRLDLALALLLSVLGVALMAENKYSTDGPAHVSFLALPAFVIVSLALLWRSTDPLVGLVAVIVALGLHFALFGKLVRCGVAVPVIALLTFSAAARLDRREAAFGLGLGLIATVALCATDWLGFGIISAAVPATVISWGVGRVSHSHGRLAEQLRARNQQLRVARDERARLEVATDRAQLSAELEVLLHRRLGELAKLAGQGAGSVTEGTAVALLADIERESRATLDEMRTLVGVLRSDESGTVVEPQPSLTSLDALLVRSGGGQAQLRIDGSPRALPAGVELTAYRVVEHLLEALDDAPGVQVLVRFAPDTLELTVEGPARRRGQLTTALGRVRERVELHRGSLTTHTRGGRATAVAALPLRNDA
jgi:hypothetical protein